MQTEVEKKNIIVTGLPGVGKTTLIRNVLSEIRDLDPIGFYTEEVREQGVRKGFSLTGTDDSCAILAHENIQSRFRVGKYGVDIAGFEKFISSIPFRDAASRLIVIDEIGKMECLSPAFRGLISELLSSGKLVIATAALKGPGLIEHVKSRPDSELIEITRGNRESLLPGIVDRIRIKIRS